MTIKEAKGEAHISLARALAAVSHVSGGRVRASIAEVKVVRRDAAGNVIGGHAEKWPPQTKA